MPSPKNLLGKVATKKNLEIAWQDISRSTRPESHGISEETIEKFQLKLKENLEVIRSELLGGQYKFGKVRAVTIKKKTGNKRPLKIPDIRDRVVQRAMTRVLEKYLVRPFKLNNQASHAYLPGKGVQSAIKQMLTLHKGGYSIIFEGDIENFFGTVNLDKLLDQMIFPKLPDQTINKFIRDAFEMEIGNKDDLPKEDWILYPESATGLPQGGYLSPLFSNVYLSAFDQSMIRSNFQMIRYADDFIVMCKSLSEAENAYVLTKDILESDLGLKLHERNDSDKDSRTRVIRITQTTIKFLGIEFDGIRIWPNSEKRNLFSNKLDKISKRSNTVTELLTFTKNFLEGWVSAYSFTDLNNNYCETLDKEINLILWNSLNKFGWNLKTTSFSQKQRFYSGVGITKNYRDLRRTKYKEADKELFSYYWS